MEFKLSANIDGYEYDIIRNDECEGCMFEGNSSVCNHPDNRCSDLNIIYVRKKTKTCPKFKPLDPVLVRNEETDFWQASFVSYEFDGSYYTVDNIAHIFIIPLNDETKYLWNTSKKAPDEYKWW